MKQSFEDYALWLFPKNQDRNGELFKIALTVLGGLGVFYSLFLAYQRLKATNISLELQANAINKQSEQLELSRRGQFDERFKNAVEHLGSEKEPVILGGIVELHQIAKYENEKYAAVVFNILTSYLRSILKIDQSRGEDYSYTIPQTIIDFLFRGKDFQLYKGLQADLNNCNFISIDINGAQLSSCDLRFCLMPMYICDVSFENAKISRTNFTIGRIENVNFKNVEFHDCLFNLCEIKNTDFSGAEFLSSIFVNSKFYHSNFINCNLFEIKFLLCHFEHTSFSRAELLQIKYLGSNFIYTEFSENEIMNKVDFIGSGFYETTFGSQCVDCDFSGAGPRFQFDFIQPEDIQKKVGNPISKLGIKEIQGNYFLNCHWNSFSEENYKMIIFEYETVVSKWEDKYKPKKKVEEKNGT
jgi:uncharacterized protein YjbI with pentapeptide repeats